MLNNLLLGLQVALIGMAVVFFGLVCLIILIKFNQFVANTVNKAGKVKEQIKEEKPQAKAVEAPKAPAKAPSNDNSVIAAITAAISVVMEGQKFKVKSVKKVSGTSGNVNAWDIAAMQEQNNNF